MKTKKLNDERPIFVRLTPELRTKLDREVARLQKAEPGLTASALVRRLLAQAFAKAA